MVYPTLPRKKQQEPIRENNVDPLAPFPNKKIKNPTTQDPNPTTTRIVKIWKHSKVYNGKRKKVYNGTCYHVRPWMG